MKFLILLVFLLALTACQRSVSPTLDKNNNAGDYSGPRNLDSGLRWLLREPEWENKEGNWKQA